MAIELPRFYKQDAKSSMLAMREAAAGRSASMLQVLLLASPTRSVAAPSQFFDAEAPEPIFDAHARFLQSDVQSGSSGSVVMLDASPQPSPSPEPGTPACDNTCVHPMVRRTAIEAALHHS